AWFLPSEKLGTNSSSGFTPAEVSPQRHDVQSQPPTGSATTRPAAHFPNLVVTSRLSMPCAQLPSLAMKKALLICSTLACMSLHGCVLTNIKVPLDTDLQNTDLGDKTGQSSYRSV